MGPIYLRLLPWPASIFTTAAMSIFTMHRTVAARADNARKAPRSREAARGYKVIE
ncbi:hypothetical protein PP358_gp31 [Arthrobacter phage Shoya]|uniref:Uncharacterized protein n=1 Tax=Arthrobacter phage Shoya TaxID=2704035 RepID=A0A6G6XHW8_9CAUD|nr:hypothetical protein PP358_gp31 [Arthrobacter phage Shoya]QIG57702.1 hypothetical protein SEA_SHOYA_31 [Arthrobacter phage Shoya]